MKPVKSLAQTRTLFLFLGLVITGGCSNTSNKEVEQVAVGPLPVNNEPFDLSEETLPAINPGGVANGKITLNGTEIEYATVTPKGFEIGDQAPVFLTFPPGSQSIDLADNTAKVFFRKQGVNRGWVVVCLAAPGATWDNDTSAQHIPEVLRWIRAWVKAEGGKPHMGGMSRGGISAFHIGALNPDKFQSLLAFPGFANSPSDQAALKLIADNMPVRLWVGGDDEGWVAKMETTTSQLESSGGDVKLKSFPGEPHMIKSILDGNEIFDALESIHQK
jgi:predicted esterase